MYTDEMLNLIVEYIEANLAHEIEYERLSQIACCSEYEMRRVFSSVAGVPIGEYIRRRRMTLAAQELTQSGIRVIDVAQRYGYESPDSFSRAFQRHHGATPAAVREGKACITAFQRLSFYIAIKGNENSVYRIEKKEAFRFVGKTFRIGFEGVQCQRSAAACWEKLAPSDFQTLIPLSNVRPHGLLGVMTNADETGYDYSIAAATTQEPPGGYEVIEVPAYEWTVFYGQGPLLETLSKLRYQFQMEWLPVSGYEAPYGIDFEWYGMQSLVAQENQAELWIPVRLVSETD